MSTLILFCWNVLKSLAAKKTQQHLPFQTLLCTFCFHKKVHICTYYLLHVQNRWSRLLHVQNRLITNLWKLVPCENFQEYPRARFQSIYSINSIHCTNLQYVYIIVSYCVWLTKIVIHSWGVMSSRRIKNSSWLQNMYYSLRCTAHTFLLDGIGSCIQSLFDRWNRQARLPMQNFSAWQEYRGTLEGLAGKSTVGRRKMNL